MLASLLLWLISTVNAVFIAELHDFPHVVKPGTRVQLTIIFNRDYGALEKAYLMMKDLSGIKVLYKKNIFDEAPKYSSTARIIRSLLPGSLEGVGLFSFRKVELSVTRMIIFDTIIPRNIEPGDYCISFTFPTSNVKLNVNYFDVPLRVLARDSPELAEEATTKANILFAGECELFVANMHNRAIRNMADGKTGEVMYRHFRLTWYLGKTRMKLLRTVWSQLTWAHAAAATANYMRIRRALKRIETWLEEKFSRAFVEKVRTLSNKHDYNGMMKFAEEMHIPDSDVFEQKRRNFSD